MTFLATLTPDPDEASISACTDEAIQEERHACAEAMTGGLLKFLATLRPSSAASFAELPHEPPWDRRRG